MSKLSPISLQVAKNIAEKSFNDALSALATIEVLEAANMKAVISAVNERNHQLPFQIMRDAMLTHLVLLAIRPFDPPRNDDQHVGALVERLRSPSDLMRDIEAIGGKRPAALARQLFDRLQADARREEIKHFRDKNVAHASMRNPNVPFPRWGILFAFTREGAKVAELLHSAVGAGDRSLQRELKAYRRQAVEFWDFLADPA